MANGTPRQEYWTIGSYQSKKKTAGQASMIRLSVNFNAYQKFCLEAYIFFVLYKLSHFSSHALLLEIPTDLSHAESLVKAYLAW